MVKFSFVLKFGLELVTGLKLLVNEVEFTCINVVVPDPTVLAVGDVVIVMLPTSFPTQPLVRNLLNDSSKTLVKLAAVKSLFCVDDFESFFVVVKRLVEA